MARSTWMKYIALGAAFAGVGMQIFNWLTKAQGANSPGGQDIVPEEIPALQGVITEAVNHGLTAGEVPLRAEVKLYYVGDIPGTGDGT